ncbi:MAG: hypothetical protein ABI777_06550 [Betaproteobacteria bacterium]
MPVITEWLEGLDEPIPIGEPDDGDFDDDEDDDEDDFDDDDD